MNTLEKGRLFPVKVKSSHWSRRPCMNSYTSDVTSCALPLAYFASVTQSSLLFFEQTRQAPTSFSFLLKCSVPRYTNGYLLYWSLCPNDARPCLLFKIPNCPSLSTPNSLLPSSTFSLFSSSYHHLTYTIHQLFITDITSLCLCWKSHKKKHLCLLVY